MKTHFQTPKALPVCGHGNEQFYRNISHFISPFCYIFISLLVLIEMLKLNGGLVVDNSYNDFFFEINIIIMTIL